MEANKAYSGDHLTPTNVVLAEKAGEYISYESEPMQDVIMNTSDLPSEKPASAQQETHYFVNLLDAATTAAGEVSASARSNISHTMDMPKAKRKRSLTSPETSANSAPPGSKRARANETTTTGPAKDVARARTFENGSDYETRPDLTTLYSTNAPGVHSAVALFRRTSQKSSRPPMSTLFMSLQLLPEDFLLLQSQAKSYMLDPAYPERQRCVGRGKGDTAGDTVKLRLFNCVRDFLNDGSGERFFGENSINKRQHEGESMEVAKALGEDYLHTNSNLVWPRDGNKLIGLVTPLLRRMVTNERQRVYAIETRKGNGARKKEGSMGAASKTPPATDPAIFARLSPLQNHDSPVSVASLDNCSSNVPPGRSQPLESSDATTMSVPLSLPFSCSIAKLPPGNSADQQHHLDQTAHIKHLHVGLKKQNRTIGSIRFHHTEEAPLFLLSWSELLRCISHLIKECDQDVSRKASVSIGPGTLRGLAVAATQAQTGNPGDESCSSMEPASPTSNITDGSQHVFATSMPEATSRHEIHTVTTIDASSSQIIDNECVVPYRIEAIRSTGRALIKNESDWKTLKVDIAFADWADRTLNAVVILQ